MAERTLHGTGVTPRSGVGSVIWYGRDIALPDPDDAEVDPETEGGRFADAVDTARDELESEREATAKRIGEDEAAVFDAHIQFIEDPTIEEAVETIGNSPMEKFKPHIIKNRSGSDKYNMRNSRYRRQFLTATAGVTSIVVLDSGLLADRLVTLL